MIYVDFVVHCDARDCTKLAHVPVDDAIHGTTAHVAVKIPRRWQQRQDGVYCEDHAEAV